jgi:hypothetical protein
MKVPINEGWKFGQSLSKDIMAKSSQGGDIGALPTRTCRWRDSGNGEGQGMKQGQGIWVTHLRVAALVQEPEAERICKPTESNIIHFSLAM